PRIEPFLREQLPRELDVLAGIGRSILDEDPLLRDAQAGSNRGELIGFRLLPQMPRDRPKSTGEDQQRRPALEKQRRASLGDRLVVAAQHQDRIGTSQLMVDVMVVPERLSETANPIIHHTGFWPARNRSRRRTRSVR